MMRVALIGALLLPATGAVADGPMPPAERRVHVQAMLRDAEDMVAHGGMGDAAAIVHHCGGLVAHAEALLGALPPDHPHGREAAAHLRRAVAHCRRVASLGASVDPGLSLNPATKARAAARDAARHLSAIGD